tara:strand:- start:177 stop:338 length:162 start_codon:yes stop_codon:yes gene_type:complete
MKAIVKITIADLDNYGDFKNSTIPQMEEEIKRIIIGELYESDIDYLDIEVEIP